MRFSCTVDEKCDLRHAKNAICVPNRLRALPPTCTSPFSGGARIVFGWRRQHSTAGHYGVSPL
eukprot:5478807-Prymnesium_polylepis.1